MAIIFAAPAATGKTRFKEELKEHFGCDAVYDDGEHLAGRKPGANSLVLCQRSSDVKVQGRVLDQDQMNRAMVAVGGIAIWNDDGSVNTFGKRKGLK